MRVLFCIKFSDDYGKDLISVQKMQKKHTLLEADFEAHKDRIEGVEISAKKFLKSGHFDAENINEKKVGCDF